ncbi:MAG: hypothetical protein ACI8RD_007625 [Bacillariaceae sp.]
MGHVVIVIVNDLDQKVGLGHNDSTVGFQKNCVVVVVDDLLSMFLENSLHHVMQRTNNE